MTMTTSDSYMGLDKVYSLLVDDTPLCMDVIHIVMDCCGGSCIVEARRKRVDLLHLISMSSYSPLRLASSALQICHQGASIPVDCLAKSDMMQSLTIAADPRPTTETISSSPRDFNVFQFRATGHRLRRAHQPSMFTFNLVVPDFDMRQSMWAEQHSVASAFRTYLRSGDATKDEVGSFGPSNRVVEGDMSGKTREDSLLKIESTYLPAFSTPSPMLYGAHYHFEEVSFPRDPIKDNNPFLFLVFFQGRARSREEPNEFRPLYLRIPHFDRRLHTHATKNEIALALKEFLESSDATSIDLKEFYVNAVTESNVVYFRRGNLDPTSALRPASVVEYGEYLALPHYRGRHKRMRDEDDGR